MGRCGKKICFGHALIFGIGIEFLAVQLGLFPLWVSVVRGSSQFKEKCKKTWLEVKDFFKYARCGSGTYPVANPFSKEFVKMSGEKSTKVLFIFRCSKNWQKKSMHHHLLTNDGAHLFFLPIFTAAKDEKYFRG